MVGALCLQNYVVRTRAEDKAKRCRSSYCIHQGHQAHSSRGKMDAPEQYSGTSDSGHSEEQTTSLQWTKCMPPANNCMHLQRRDNLQIILFPNVSIVQRFHCIGSRHSYEVIAREWSE